MNRLWLKSRIVLLTVIALVVAFIPAASTQAGTVVSLKDTLSDSRPAVTSNHTFVLVMSAGTSFDAGDTMTFTFASGFTGVGSVVGTDLTFNDGTSRSVLVGSCSAGNNNIGFAVASQTVTLTACSTYTSSSTGATVTVTFAGSHLITNDVAGSYTETVAGSYGDSSKDTTIVIVAPVTVSATVAENISLSLAQGGACAGDSGSPSSVNSSVTATTVPFGSVNTNTFYVGCQDLTATTNAAGGYVVTSQELTNLQAGSTNLIDTTCDSGSCSESSGASWATATANQGLGFSCENITNTPCTNNAVTTYRQFACTGSNANCDPGSGGETPQSTLSKGSGANGDVARIHYKLSVSPTQTAGTYSNTVEYIMTGTF